MVLIIHAERVEPSLLCAAALKLARRRVHQYLRQ